MRRELLVAVCVLAASNVLAARPYRGGVAATAHPRATEAAISMLEKGGNAVDAAVAAAFALGVVDPAHSGIGGGGFALVFEAKGNQSHFLDFREVAPKAATRNMYLKEGRPVADASTDGGLSVAVPGAVAGYFELLSTYGLLKPEIVLAPAIRAANEGFYSTPGYQQLTERRLACLRAHPEAARIFLRPNSNGAPDVPPIGTFIRQTDLAKTLARLARRGPEAFYSGPIATAMVSAVQKDGGILTLEDLARFKTRRRQPLEATYRGYKILTAPPPSAGGLAVQQVLGMMEIQEPKGFAFHDAEAIHVYAEALRRAYLDRVKYLGDPAQVDIPLQKLSSREHIVALSGSINRAHATASQSLFNDGGTLSPPGERHTAHISVLDRDGNAVSLTTTVNYYFGSCLVPPGTGILLNDQMNDFTVAPLSPNVYALVTGEANAIAPGKVPLSSMAPTLVFQREQPSKVLLAVGAAGGPTIPTTVIQVISNLIDQQMDLTRAVAVGRIHHQFLPDELVVEHSGVDPATISLLEALGHRISRENYRSETEAVMEDEHSHLRYSASDPRNEGAALGQD